MSKRKAFLVTARLWDVDPGEIPYSGRVTEQGIANLYISYGEV